MTAAIRGWRSLAEGLSREVWRASLASATTRIAGVGVAFAVGVVLARQLGPGQYGAYGTVMSVAAIASVGASMGAPQLVMREAALLQARGDRSALQGLLRWSGLTGLLSVGALAIATLAAWLVLAGGGIAGVAVQVAFLVGIMLCVTNLVGGLLRGLGAVVSGQAMDVLLRPALLLGALLAVVALGVPMDAGRALALQVAAGGLALLAGVGVLAAVFPRHGPDAPRRADARRWFRGALPMGATEVVRAVDGHYPILVLALVGTVAQVGEFKVAAALAIFLLLPYSIFNSVAVPIAARLSAQGRKDEIQRFATFCAVVSTVASLLATIGLLLVGRGLIVAIFGADFAGAWSVLVILCLAQIVHSAFGINPALLNAVGHEMPLFRWFLVSLAVGFALSVAMTLAFGMYGMAWSIVLAAMIRVAVLHLHTVRRLGIDCSIFAALPPLTRGAVT